MKFAENVDILVEIINAKFENERGKDTGCTKTRKLFFVKKISGWCSVSYSNY